MPLVLDASTPAVATANATTVTTASFTPPAGSVLVAVALHATGGQTTTRDSIISSSNGLYWISQGSTPLGPSPAPNGSLARVWTAVVPTSTAMTVTSTGTANSFNGCMLAVLVYTGADTRTPIEGLVAGASTGVISQAITAAVDGAAPWLGNIDYQGQAAPTPGSGVTTYATAQPAGAGYDRMWVANRSVISPPGTVTISSTAPTSGALNSWIAFAVKPGFEHVFSDEVPALTDLSDGTPGITTATTFRTAVDGQVPAVSFYATSTVSGTYTVGLWTVDSNDPGGGTLLASKTMSSAPVGGAWNSVAFDNPVTVTAGVAYRCGVFNSAGRYVATTGFFTIDLVNGNLTADATGDTVGGRIITQGTFRIDSNVGYPNANGNGTCYFVDVDFTPGTGGPVTGSVTLAATGALSGSATRATSITAVLAGTGGLTGAAVTAVSSSVNLAGVGALAAAGVRTQDTTATLAATGALSGAAVRTQTSAVTLAGTGAVAGAGVVAADRAATLAATGGLTASADRTAVTAATLTATGGLTAAGAATRAGTVTLSATAGFDASGTTVTPGVSSGTLAAVGTLSGVAALTGVAATVLAATGTLTGSGERVASGTAVLAGQGALTPAATAVRVSVVTFAGVAALASVADIVNQETAALAATGTLTGSGQAGRATTAVLPGVGVLAGVSGTASTATATLAAVGTLTAATTYRRRPGRYTAGAVRSTLTVGSTRPTYRTGGVDG